MAAAGVLRRPPLRGILASPVISQWGIYPVQFLDSVGTGIQSVAIPGLVARILDGPAA